MRLCEMVGELDPYALLDRIPERIFQLWSEWDCYEPIGGRRLDWNAAMISRHILYSAGRKFDKVGRTSEFLLKLKPVNHRQNLKDMEAQITAWVNAAKAVHGEGSNA